MSRELHDARLAWVRELCRRFPVGSPVRYWKGAKVEAPKLGTIRGPFSILPCGEVVGWIEGEPSCIAATHIEEAAAA